jgi:hypothetical protein
MFNLKRVFVQLEEGDLLEVPANRQRSPRTDSPNTWSYLPPNFPAEPRSGMADFPVCTGVC